MIKEYHIQIGGLETTHLKNMIVKMRIAPKRPEIILTRKKKSVIEYKVGPYNRYKWSEISPTSRMK